MCLRLTFDSFDVSIYIAYARTANDMRDIEWNSYPQLSVYSRISIWKRNDRSCWIFKMMNPNDCVGIQQSKLYRVWWATRDWHKVVQTTCSTPNVVWNFQFISLINRFNPATLFSRKPLTQLFMALAVSHADAVTDCGACADSNAKIFMIIPFRWREHESISYFDNLLIEKIYFIRVLVHFDFPLFKLNINSWIRIVVIVCSCVQIYTDLSDGIACSITFSWRFYE